MNQSDNGVHPQRVEDLENYGAALEVPKEAMKQDVAWEKYRQFTLAIGVLANLPGVVLWVSFFTTRIPEWEGVIQRLGLLFPLLWVFVLSFRQLHLSTEKR